MAKRKPAAPALPDNGNPTICVCLKRGKLQWKLVGQAGARWKAADNLTLACDAAQAAGVKVPFNIDFTDATD